MWNQKAKNWWKVSFKGVMNSAAKKAILKECSLRPRNMIPTHMRQILNYSTCSGKTRQWTHDTVNIIGTSYRVL